MLDHPGSIAYLRQMAERCRHAARELDDAEAHELLALAECFEERLAERERADELVTYRQD